jgi:hypothetical protein
MSSETRRPTEDIEQTMKEIEVPDRTKPTALSWIRSVVVRVRSQAEPTWVGINPLLSSPQRSDITAPGPGSHRLLRSLVLSRRTGV